MMADLSVHWRLCVNEHLVPVEQATLSFVDPYKLAEEEPDVPLPVTLVSFQASMNAHWLQAPLALPARWWVQHHAEVPLLREILQLIKDKKPQGRLKLMPKNPKCLLPLQIRGKTLWFENNTRRLKLALRQNLEQPVLLWFLQELNKDILALGARASFSAHSEASVFGTDSEEDLQHETPDVPDNIKDLVDENLSNLSEHAQCASVNFQRSRHSFRITRKDKVVKQVRVPNLKKNMTKALKMDTNENLQQAFHMALAAGEDFLNSCMDIQTT